MKKFPQIVAIVLACALTTTSCERICRSLAVSGAGSFGAYETGALKGLLEVHKGNPVWSKVSGISAGAITASFMAQHNIGDEAAGIEELIDLWTSLSNKDIFQPFNGLFSYIGFPQANGFFFQSGVYDTTPLLNELRKRIDGDKIKSSDRDWVIAATNMNDGTLDFFGKDTSDPVLAAKGSASIPVLFNATWYEGKGKLICFNPLSSNTV